MCSIRIKNIFPTTVASAEGSVIPQRLIFFSHSIICSLGRGPEIYNMYDYLKIRKIKEDVKYIKKKTKSITQGYISLSK